MRVLTLFFVGFVIGNRAADAAVFDSFNVGMSQIELTDDSVITNRGALYSDDIRVTESIALVNYGTISGHVYIADGVRLNIQNSGEMDVGFHLGNRASLIQTIRSNDDITDIGVSGGASIVVRDASGISLRRVYALAGSNTHLVLDNSDFVLDGVIENLDIPVTIIGDVFVHVDDVSSGDPIMRNVSGDGRVHVVSDNVSPIHAMQSYVKDGNVYVRMVRETDYSKIFNNDVGVFLDNLRLIYPSDWLLRKMDAADSIASLGSIMARSVRLHPINLMRPLRVLNSFRMGLADSVLHGAGGGAEYITSDDFEIYLGHVGMGTDFGRHVRAGLKLYVGQLVYADDINDYSGVVTGGDLRINYNRDLWNIDLLFGAGYARFDIGPVYDDGRVVNNPYGISGYGAMNFGLNLSLFDNVSMVPFVGIGGEYLSVLDDGISDISGRIGAEINFASHEYSLHYDYCLRVAADTDAGVGGGVRMKIWSPGDDAGGDIGLDVIDGDVGTSFRIYVNGAFKF